MNKVYVKKRGRQGTVYLDDGRPLPIANMEDEPMGFPFTARMEEIQQKFGTNLVIIENTEEPRVSSTKVSDAELLKQMPEAKGEMNFVPGPILSGAPAQQAPLPLPEPSTPFLVQGVEARALVVFTDMVRRWHYARGKDKKELAQEIEAVASFLITVDESLGQVLVEIKERETGFNRKKFSL